MAHSLGFCGGGLSFWVVFSQSFYSVSFLVVNTLFSQDGCQGEGLWEVVGHVVSPFDPSGILPVVGGLLVLCSLPGPPVIRPNSYCGEWPGWAVSVPCLP